MLNTRQAIWENTLKSVKTGCGMQDDTRYWFILNHIVKSTATCAKSAEKKIQRFNARESASLELFAPTIVSVIETDGRNVLRNKPLIFHYIFVKGRFSEVKRLCGMANGFSFLLNRGSNDRYAIISDQQMENFKVIALEYQNRLPFFSIEDIDLEDGDKVEVVEGAFPGLVGFFIPRHKSTNGNIVLGVTRNLGTVAYDINAKYVRVLEFSKKFRRGYDQIDAFIPKLYDALRRFSRSETPSKRDIGALTIFCRRMEIVKMNNSKIEAKLDAILAAANHILGNREASRNAKERFAKHRPAITSVSTTAFVLLLDSVIENSTDDFKKGLTFMELSTEKESKSLARLWDEYNYYKEYFKI